PLFRAVAVDSSGRPGADASDAPFPLFFGTAGAAAAAPRELAMSAVTPNPSRGAIRLGLSVAKAVAVRATLVDIQSRTVQVLAEGSFQPGRYSLRWAGVTGR